LYEIFILTVTIEIRSDFNILQKSIIILSYKISFKRKGLETTFINNYQNII